MEIDIFTLIKIAVKFLSIISSFVIVCLIILQKNNKNHKFDNFIKNVITPAFYTFYISMAGSILLYFFPGTISLGDYMPNADTIKIIQKVDIALCGLSFLVFTVMYYIRKFSDSIFMDKEEFKSKFMLVYPQITQISLYAIAFFAAIAYILNIFVKK